MFKLTIRNKRTNRKIISAVFTTRADAETASFAFLSANDDALSIEIVHVA